MLCTSVWHLPHSFPCLWMLFPNSNYSMRHENEISLKGKYVVLADHVTYAHFCLPKGIDCWFWKGGGDCGCSSEFRMDVGISWKQASKCFCSVRHWHGWVLWREEQGCGKKTGLHSLYCCFFPLIDGVAGWEIPTVLGFLRFCFSEEMSYFVKSLTCWLFPPSGVLPEGLWTLHMRQYPPLDSLCHGLFVSHPGSIGYAWEMCIWVFIQTVPRHVTQMYWFENYWRNPLWTEKSPLHLWEEPCVTRQAVPGMRLSKNFLVWDNSNTSFWWHWTQCNRSSGILESDQIS